MKIKFKGNVVLTKEQALECVSLCEEPYMGWEWEEKEFGKSYNIFLNGEYGKIDYNVNHTTETITILSVK